MAQGRNMVICKALTILFSKNYKERQIEKRLLKNPPKPTSQLYFYFSNNFYTLSLKHLADANEYSHKKNTFFGGRKRCQTRCAHCRVGGCEGLTAAHGATRAVKARRNVDFQGTCTGCTYMPYPVTDPAGEVPVAKVLSVSPLVSGITNRCSSLIFSCCTFSRLPKCSNHPNSAEQKSEARSVLHYSCCQSRNQKSKFSFLINSNQ